jgi:hypothetical protein
VTAPRKQLREAKAQAAEKQGKLDALATVTANLYAENLALKKRSFCQARLGCLLARTSARNIPAWVVTSRVPAARSERPSRVVDSSGGSGDTTAPTPRPWSPSRVGGRPSSVPHLGRIRRRAALITTLRALLRPRIRRLRLKPFNALASVSRADSARSDRKVAVSRKQLHDD